MEPLPDYYAALGLEPGADERAIKRAWRTAAREAHPDVPSNQGSPGAEARWRGVREAWEVLSNPETRQRYDQARLLERAWSQSGTRGPEGAQRDVHQEAGARVADLFADLFSQGAGPWDPEGPPRRDREPPPPRPPEPDRPRAPGGFRVRSSFVHVEREIRPQAPPPEEHHQGSAELLRIDLDVPLRLQCLGGTWSTDIRVFDLDGRPVIERLEVGITLPFEDGRVIRVPGRGHHGRGGRGEAAVTLRAAADPHLRREGDDIVLDVPLTPSEAASGTRVRVPTLDGPVSVQIPAGIRGGQRLRLRDRGPIIGAERRGAQVLHLRIELPSGLSSAEVEGLRRLEEKHSFEPRRGLWEGC